MRIVVIVLILLPILLLAAGVRLHVARMQDRRAQESTFAPFNFPDSLNFQAYADHLLAGEGYIDDAGRYAWRTPGYPLFLAGLGKVGLGTPRRVRRVQVGIDTVNCLLVFLLASLLFRPAAGLLAAGMYAVYPFIIFMNGLVISETLSHSAILLSMLVLVWWLVPRPGAPNPAYTAQTWRFVCGGLLVGGLLAVGVLIKTSFAMLIVPVILFLFVRMGLPGNHRLQVSLPLNAACARKRTLRGILLVLAGWLIVMAPWWIRNACVFDTFVPFSTMSGFTMWEATAPGGDGGPNHAKVTFPIPYARLKMLGKKEKFWDPDVPHPDYGMMQRGEFVFAKNESESVFAGTRADLELEMNRTLWQTLRDGWTVDKWRMIGLSKNKLLRTWRPVPNWTGASDRKYTLLMFFSYIPVMLLALYGAWRYRQRWFEVGVLLLPALYLAVVHGVIMGSIRYRLPAMGCLIVLAAGGAGVLLDTLLWRWFRKGAVAPGKKARARPDSTQTGKM